MLDAIGALSNHSLFLLVFPSKDCGTDTEMGLFFSYMHEFPIYIQNSMTLH